MRRILVTGAGGFIGRVLTESLARKGFKVVAVDNNSRGSLDGIQAKGSIDRCECDVLDGDRLQTLVKGSEVIYHLAAINGTGNFYAMPDKVLEVGIIGTHNVLKACIANKVKRVVFVSTSEVYHLPRIIPTPEDIECKVPDVFNPRFSYGGGKIAGELMTIHYLSNAGIPYIIVRPHNVYGPNMGFEHVIPQIIEKLHRRVMGIGGVRKVSVEIQGTGEETRSFIFITDAIQAIEICTLYEAPSGIYHIGTEHEVTIKELIRLIGEVLGLEVEIVPSPLQQGSASRRCPATNKINALGFKSNVSLMQGLVETVHWYWDYYNHKNGSASKAMAY